MKNSTNMKSRIDGYRNGRLLWFLLLLLSGITMKANAGNANPLIANGASPSPKVMMAPAPPPAVLVATPDTAIVANSYSGAVNVINILANDSVDGLPATAGAVKISVNMFSHPFVLDTLTGWLTVPPGVASGWYAFTYDICDTGNLTNCYGIQVVNVHIIPTPIEASWDAATVNGYNNTLAAVNVFSNDKVNNVFFGPGGADLFLLTPASNPKITLNLTTGAVDVQAGVPAGDYSIVYRLRDTMDAFNFDTSIVYIKVTAPVVSANWDAGEINGYVGSASLLNVLANDSVNSSNIIAGAATLSLVTPASNPKVSLNLATGVISVASGCLAGNYSIVYRICDTLNPTNCDTSIVYVTVSAPVIAGNADEYNVNGYNGNLNLGVVLSNDQINGATASAGRVTLTIVSPASDPAVILNTANGRVSVFPMTPAGDYTIIYRICDTLNVTNCDTALVTIHVLPPPILADADVATVNGYNGNASLVNVFANDKLNGSPTALGNVNLSVITGSGHPNVTLNTLTGYAAVAPMTPAGTYSIVYQICDTLNPVSCDTGLITIHVNAPVIAGNADFASVNGYNGNPALMQVLSNDQINAGSIAVGGVALSVVTPASDPKITLDTATGMVMVNPMIPAGTYTLIYSICDTLNPSNCDTALVTVVVNAPLIKADPDQGSVNGYVGNPALLNAALNDSINGFQLFSMPRVAVTLVTPASSPNIVFDTATGVVSVIPPVAAGNYSIVYRICDSLNVSSCDTAIIHVQITAPLINAINDTFSVNGYVGGALGFGLANDSINMIPVGPGGVNFSVFQPAIHPGITMNLLTSQVAVAPLTPAGNYTIGYKIWDTLNASNIDTGWVLVMVGAPAIDAINDTASGNGYNAGVIGNVLINDSLNNMVLPTNAAHVSVIAAASNPGVTLNLTNGDVVLSPRIPAGTYTIRYRICDTLNPGNCDSAQVHVIITAPAIDAVNDTATVNNYAGSPGLINVLLNDTLNGLTLMSGQVKVTTLISSGHAGVKLNDTTGIIHVDPYVPVGVYTIRYQICDTVNLTNCDSAEAVIFVNPPAILALDDSAFADGYYGDTLVMNAWSNDLFNGVMVNAVNVKTITLTNASHPGITFNDTTGVVAVKPGTPAGNYFIEYSIRDTFNLFNADTAWIKIMVLPPSVIATNDTAVVNGYIGKDSLINVLTNDSVGGVLASLLNTQRRIWIPATNLNVVMDTISGYVHVKPGVPAGFFHIYYLINDTVNIGNTDTGIAVIQVLGAPISANADEVHVNGYDGKLNLYNVLSNDTLNGLPISPGGVHMNVLFAPVNSNIVLNTVTGSLSVFAGTFAGDYQIIYQICDTLNPGNCDTALINLHVAKPLLDAVNDTATVNGYFGAFGAVDVLFNDTLNNWIANIPGVFVNVISPSGNAGVVLDTAIGYVNVLPQTAAGVYHIQYEITDTLNPGNRDTAWVTITVNAPVLVAVNDTGVASSYSGAVNLLNVLVNDSLEGMVVTPGMVKLNEITPFGNAGLSFDTLTGFVSVAPLTPSGSYLMQYRICDTLNVGNCKTAWVKVDVLPIIVTATPDSASVNGYFGSPVVMNVLSNDSLNGLPLSPAAVHLSVVVPSGVPAVVLDTITGNIKVDPKTAGGTYFISYQICDTLSPGICHTGLATIFVYAVAPVALPDTGLGAEHLPIVVYPLNNDFDTDGNLDSVSLAITVPPLHGIASVDPITHSITYVGDTLWSGIDTLYYSVCDSGMVPVSCGYSFVVFGVIGQLRLDTVYITLVTCTGDSNGAATVVVYGGIPPYTYTWNTVPVQTGPTATNLKAGTYTVTVVDTFGQILPVDVNIVATSTLTNTFVTKDPNCYGASTGQINLTPSGGTPPYRYLWNTGHILEDLTGLTSGTYFVRVTDTVGCSKVSQVTLYQPTPIVISAVEIHDVYCKDQTEGYILTTTSGGVTPYKYLWNVGDTSANLYGRSNGNYTITVSDSAGCTAEKLFTINFQRADCEQKVFVPQGFSPDGDGVNDAFVIEGILNHPDNHLRIYNRWGSVVYEKYGYKNDWQGTQEEGTSLGSDDGRLPTGTYYFILKLDANSAAISGYIFISKN